MAPLSAELQISAPKPLSARHDLSSFDCGEPALNDWLKTRALKSEGRHARTYVVVSEGAVVGFYALSAGSVERAATPGRLRRNAPDSVPVTILGRLGVDRRQAGRGLGGDLLADALGRVAKAAGIIGLGAVLVHAKSDAARAFYMRHAEFLDYPAGGRTLFLPVESIVAETE